jgi:hypothetical protein
VQPFKPFRLKGFLFVPAVDRQKRRKMMKKLRIFNKWALILVCCAFAGLSATDSSAAITPVAPFQAEALPDPNPPAFDFSSSIAYYNDHLIYAGEDRKIYGYNLATSDSVVISDTSSLTLGLAAQGFFVSSDGYLYFHDNAVNNNVPQSIYRLKLSDSWPADYETLVTDATSAIFAFTENPWTNAIWFSSSDFFGSGNNYYLYEIDSSFTRATLRSSFAQQHSSGGNGPIIFKGSDTILYGEAVFAGDGFFHLVNSSTGELFQADYLTLTGGLGDATYGYNNRIYATSGGGKAIFELRGSSALLAVGTTDGEARGLSFGDANFYVSEMVPFTTGTGDDGKISFNRGSDPSAVTEISPVDPFRARTVDDPNPPAFDYSSSIAYYNNYLIYAGEDRKIYGYNLATSDSVVISDTSLLTLGLAAQGFFVSSDDYLYFHDNAVTDNIYRLKLTDTWPADYTPIATGITSAIFAFTENPWTNAVWFSSSDFFGSGNNFYLYEIDAAFTKTTLRSSFEKKGANSGNGPIIFENETTLLYGESVFLGDGYFHQVNTATGAVIQADYLTFAGGLGDATHGYNNRIYATSGGGKSIFEIDGTQQTLLATTFDEARGITFDGISLFISAMVPFSGSADDGKIGLLELWQTRLAGVPADQRVADSVDLNEDGTPDNRQPDVILAVTASDGSGSKQIGVGPVAVGTDVFIEALEAVAAGTIDETANRPTDFPFGLINYRLKVNSVDGIARVTVYLSEAAPAGAKWYKYDTFKGWIDYSDHATFSGDRRSVTIELKDGDYGDLDRIVNGEIVDPGGVGVTASSTPPVATSGGGGGGGGCFIDSAGRDALKQNCTISYLLIPVVLLLGIGIFVRLRRE